MYIGNNYGKQIILKFIEEIGKSAENFLSMCLAVSPPPGPPYHHYAQPIVLNKIQMYSNY